MDIKTEEKHSGHHDFCGGFLGRCFKNTIVRVVISLFLAAALFSVGAAWGSHLVGRYTRMNNGGASFFKNGFHHGRAQFGRGGCIGSGQPEINFMRQNPTGQNQGQYQGGRMMNNNNQFGPNGGMPGQAFDNGQVPGQSPSTSSSPTPDFPINQ